MRHSLIAISIALTLFLTNTCLCFGQTAQTANAQTDKIKQKVEKIGIRNKITIIKFDNREFYGTILNIEADHVDIAEIDERQLVRVRFDEIRKVRKGFGDKNAFGGGRANPNKRLIGGLIVGGIFATLIILVATQLK